MVNLTRIYTRTGDAGTTRLSDLSETAKTDPRVQAYGHVDEANSIIGLATVQPDLPENIRSVLAHIQNELFDCGADLSNPLKANQETEPLRVEQAYIDRLEAWCDEYSTDLPALRSFILPGGSAASAWLHLARTVVRRAERTAWAAAAIYGAKAESEDRPGGVNLMAITYLNRLSDLLFILARAAGQASGEVLWVPGKDREAPNRKTAKLRAELAAANITTGEAETPAPGGPTDPTEAKANPAEEDSPSPDHPEE